MTEYLRLTYQQINKNNLICLFAGEDLVSKSSNEVEEAGEHLQRGGRRAHEVERNKGRSNDVLVAVLVNLVKIETHFRKRT